MKKILPFITAGLFFTVCGLAQTKVSLDDAAKNIGKTVTICDKVSGARFLEHSKTQPTLLNMGGVAPNNKLTIVINPEDRKNFTAKPEDTYAGKHVCVTGKLLDYKGKPEIIVTRPEEILTLDGGSGDPEIRTKDFLWFEQ
jgi:micrococcal nuclease